MQREQLYCCYRCPESVVRLVRYINPCVQPRAAAIKGNVCVEKTASHRMFRTVWRVSTQQHEAHGYDTLFLARGNRTLLEILLQAYRQQKETNIPFDIRWVSPTMEQGVWMGGLPSYQRWTGLAFHHQRPSLMNMERTPLLAFANNAWKR